MIICGSGSPAGRGPCRRPSDRDRMLVLLVRFLRSITVMAAARPMVDHGRQDDGWRAAPRPVPARQPRAHLSHSCLFLRLDLRREWDLPDFVCRLIPLLSSIRAHPSAWLLFAG